MRCDLPYRWFGVECRGIRPVTAFSMHGLITSISTAMGMVIVHWAFSQNVSYAAGFVMFMVIVCAMSVAVESTLYFCLGWGGGTLASPGQIKAPTTTFYIDGPIEPGDETTLDTPDSVFVRMLRDET